MEEGFTIGRKVGLRVDGGVDVVVVSTIHIRISEYEKPEPLFRPPNIGHFDFRETALGCTISKQDDDGEEEEAESQF